MSVFVDSDVFIAAFNRRDSNHSRGREILEKALDGSHGDVHTSDFVLDEIISRLIRYIEKGRLKRKEVVGLIEDTIQNSAILSLKHVDRVTLGTAKICFRIYYDKFLSLTDWSTAVLMRNLGIGRIMSFDHHFDTIKGVEEFSFIERIC